MWLGKRQVCSLAHFTLLRASNAAPQRLDEEHRKSWNIESTHVFADQHESTAQHRLGGHDKQLGMAYIMLGEQQIIGRAQSSNLVYLCKALQRILCCPVNLVS